MTSQIAPIGLTPERSGSFAIFREAAYLLDTKLL